ncbi:MAG: zinc-binding alcohol dehydrogenase family protein [Caldilineaceae bacterium]|nr:zinc-binding alcohol dehydrogenase family protein [Caldilineaceae bacterium]
MKAVILDRPGQLELVDVPPPPPPGKDEVQLAVCHVGICGTDLHAYRGDQPFFSYPRILGHELSLKVLAIGETSQPYDLAVGDLCCVRPYFHCGHCGACRRGDENCCENMQVLGVHRDGGMQEIINIPIQHLHKSDVLSPETLALVEMLSISRHGIQRAKIKPDEVVLVVGMGPIGLGAALFAHLAGARVMAMDISDRRLAFASQQHWIERCVDARLNVIEQLKVATKDDLPLVVIDATGNAGSMMKSFDYAAHGGRIVFLGLVQGDITFHSPEFHRREISLLATRNATVTDFSHVIALLEQGSADVSTWITHPVSISQVVDAFPSWLDVQNGVIKAMLNF